MWIISAVVFVSGKPCLTTPLTTLTTLSRAILEDKTDSGKTQDYYYYLLYTAPISIKFQALYRLKMINATMLNYVINTNGQL